MRKFGLRFGATCLCAIWCLATTHEANAQRLKANEGFSQIARARTVGEEPSNQPKLWVMEVQMKPVRLLWVNLTDPETGEKKREQVWYLCYRAISRPIARPSGDDALPDNELDPEPKPEYFVPELTLVTLDGDISETFKDVILPEAQRQILKVERANFKNSVQIVAPVPDASSAEELTPENSFYGLAIFRGIDPETDRFNVIFSGFSNGYEVAENGSVLRKTLIQEFWRPGDQFDPNLKEFRFHGEPKWIYRPDPKPRENDPDAAYNE